MYCACNLKLDEIHIAMKSQIFSCSSLFLCFNGRVFFPGNWNWTLFCSI